MSGNDIIPIDEINICPTCGKPAKLDYIQYEPARDGQEFTHYFECVDDLTNFEILWIQIYLYRIHNKRWLNDKWVTEK
jgi:hypothetical protein